MKHVTSTEANRDFSKLLKAVSHGEEVQISSRGRPMAMMAPVARHLAAPRQAAAQLLSRLNAQAQPPATAAPRDWTRDELYR